MPKATKSFSAVLTRLQSSLNWVVIYFPFDSVKVWGTRGRLRVKGEINGFAFRTSLFATSEGKHLMIVNKKMQNGGNVRPGMKAQFRMEPDLEKRVVAVPPELERVLRTSKRMEKFWQSLSTSFRNFMSAWVTEGKQSATRVRRAGQVAEMLMEVMEAEIELPPLLRQVFARNPEAAQRWQQLSPSHRRRHLLGIFYARTHDARLLRIDRAIGQIMSESRDKES